MGIELRNPSGSAAVSASADSILPGATILGVEGTYSPTPLSPTPTHVETMEDYASWSGSDVTVADSATSPGHGVLITKGSAGYSWSSAVAKKTITSADLSNCPFTVRFKLPDASTYHPRVRLVLYTGSGTPYRAYYLIPDTTTSARYYATDGWYMASGNTGVGSTDSNSPDLSDVVAIGIGLDKGGGYTDANQPSIELDEIAFYPTPDKARLLLTFDASYTAHVTAAAYLSARGMQGTFYCYPSQLGNAGRMSSSDLATIAAGGHLIGSYMYNFGDNATVDDKLDAMRVQLDTMAGYGFADSAKHIIMGNLTANGSWSSDVREALVPNYVHSVAAVGATSNQYDPHNISRNGSELSDANLTANRAALAAAIAAKAQVGYYCHALTGDDWTAFTTLVSDAEAAMDAGTLEVVRVDTGARAWI